MTPREPTLLQRLRRAESDAREAVREEREWQRILKTIDVIPCHDFATARLIDRIDRIVEDTTIVEPKQEQRLGRDMTDSTDAPG